MADRAEHSKLRLARRGRCSLGVALASFVAVQLLWSLAMDYGDTALRDPLWGRKLTLLRSRMAAEPKRPLVVILGSSRAALGLRTEALPEFEPGDDRAPPIVFNLGIMGAGPVLSVTAYELAFNQYRITELPDRAVREMLEICRRERIAAGLFLMPEASDFQSAYTADAREKLDEYLASLSREHRVPVFDATNGAADADFADGHHLLPPGAAAFAPTFDRDVLRPFLAQTISRHDLFADDASTASEVASRSPLDYETTLRR